MLVSQKIFFSLCPNKVSSDICKEPIRLGKDEPKAAFRFEIYGKVQWVLFRSSAQRMAEELNVVGFISYSSRRSVYGEVQGRVDKVVQMRYWLETVGSPYCKITSADGSPYYRISGCDYVTFRIDFKRSVVIKKKTVLKRIESLN